jgi:hypothetical protein
MTPHAHAIAQIAPPVNGLVGSIASTTVRPRRRSSVTTMSSRLTAGPGGPVTGRRARARSR